MLNLTRAIGLGIVVAAASTAGAQATTRLPVAPTSRLWIEGTSNVHDWKCDATVKETSIDIDVLTPTLETISPKMVKKISVKVPVTSLKCGNGKMDGNLRKALNADKHAEIAYTLTTFDVTPGEAKDAFTLKTVGTLAVAGSEKTITMAIAAIRLADGTIKATATVPVKMTDFGVKPPKAMFGTIKTGDEVKVKFELTVGPKSVAVIDK